MTHSQWLKRANSRRPNELPGEVLSRLDLELRELYSDLPEVVGSRISVLVREARSRLIDPNRVVRYAFLYAAAERQVQSDAVSKDHARRAKRELAGEIHGFETGYREDAEATRRYRIGRQARQQVQASFDALLGQWEVFQQVVEKYRSELPVHVQSGFSGSTLAEVGKGMHKTRIAVVLDEKDLTRDNDAERNERPVIAQTYIWWRLIVAPYSKKWSDMHQLARAWRMSPSMSAKEFQTVVRRVSKGAICATSFGNAWDSVLSKKI